MGNGVLRKGLTLHRRPENRLKVQDGRLPELTFAEMIQQVKIAKNMGISYLWKTGSPTVRFQNGLVELVRSRNGGGDEWTALMSGLDFKLMFPGFPKNSKMPYPLSCFK